MVIRDGRPTWFHKKVLMSNAIGRSVFWFCFRIEMKKRRREFQETIEEFKRIGE